jgi:hypothetical protein
VVSRQKADYRSKVASYCFQFPVVQAGQFFVIQHETSRQVPFYDFLTFQVHQ